MSDPLSDADRLLILRDGIHNYLDGDYENPRKHRPGTCEHGTSYWKACEGCTDAHFERVLRKAFNG